MLWRRDLARLDFRSETIHRQAYIGCGEILAHAAWPVWHLNGPNALSHPYARWADRDGVGSSSDGLLGLWVSSGCKIQRYVVYVNDIMLVLSAPCDACLGTTRLAARWLGSSNGLADRVGESSRFFSATAHGYRRTCREAAPAMAAFDGTLAPHRPRPATSGRLVPSRASDVPPDGDLVVAGRSDRPVNSR